jgi:hypothetical protein
LEELHAWKGELGLHVISIDGIDGTTNLKIQSSWCTAPMNIFLHEIVKHWRKQGHDQAAADNKTQLLCSKTNRSKDRLNSILNQIL